MKPLHVYSASRITKGQLPGRSAVICMADAAEHLVEIGDGGNCISRLNCLLVDQDGGERAPTAADAARIVCFVREAEADPHIDHIVFQCQAGVGRSVAAAAAFAASRGERWGNMAVYNRALYRLILSELGLKPMPEPLVALAVRVKYDAETLMGFLISLRKQRYENWEAVLFTDGPRPDIRELVNTFPTNNLVLIETPEVKGSWGHHYRQQALQVCLDSGAEWIGTNNDDNYLAPGYIEQLVRAGQRSGVKLASCCAAHRYSAWGMCQPGQDLACWLAHRELVGQVRWTKTDFWADQDYYQQLAQAAQGQVAQVPRVLVVKN